MKTLLIALLLAVAVTCSAAVDAEPVFGPPEPMVYMHRMTCLNPSGPHSWTELRRDIYDYQPAKNCPVCGFPSKKGKGFGMPIPKPKRSNQ